MSLVGVLAVAGAGGAASNGDDPLLRPIAGDYAARWLSPQPPTRIFGNSYLVGFGGLNVALIRTQAGLILIDGAVPQAVPAIERNIRALGFKLGDVKYILSTEPHYDHAGGLAALARDTGATVVASGAAAAVLRRGRSGAGDPQAAQLPPFPPVQRLRIVRDGAQLKLGDTIVTAHATPGHTAGSMSWAWRSCEGAQCAAVVFASSLNPVAAEGYRFSDPAHAAVVAAFRGTFATLRAMPCDILLTAHPDQSGGDVAFARLQQQRTPNPFVDPGACRAYVRKFERLLDKRLAKERGMPRG
ncbi:subclass B3 metallo-beta-lactamase [Sphingomonas qilianensis]|uniref:Subclass B3 metallo-beta-lactamase n=1 Tax=Sphingomonas qilianensis TaxID=1736690 RepID=A0ABU9XPH4_9SPHN